MSDVTKCKGGNCPLRDKCYRYTAPESYWQSWFGMVPWKDERCDYFVEDDDE